MKNKMLSQSVADNILAMITIEKRFSVGDKLPNEIELSEELSVSRTTLREAIRYWPLIIYWKSGVEKVLMLRKRYWNSPGI